MGNQGLMAFLREEVAAGNLASPGGEIKRWAHAAEADHDTCDEVLLGP